MFTQIRVWLYHATGQYGRVVERRIAQIRKENPVGNPYRCAACGGSIDKKGFCEICGAPPDPPDPDRCPECLQLRPGDERVRAGMKCSFCTYDSERVSAAVRTEAAL
jgi:predicted amidophosphoribosyltransferase